jgi:NADPH-dependent glutamate synthase beta subunit-like oxidoreductase
MVEKSCPVQQITDRLRAIAVTRPKSIYRVENLLLLLKEIAAGRAEDSHLDAILLLADKLTSDPQDLEAIEAGKLVQQAVLADRESFLSHIRDRNCLTGACVHLTPAPCQIACPAGIDVPAYVTLIGQGRYAEAIQVIRRTNPFPWVCGLVCTRPCESACVRGCIDTPVAIKSLKAFASEAAISAGTYTNPECMPSNNRKVCIVGAGPAGLTAAYYLALKGYQVKVIEKLSEAGGMLWVGIPRYRLPHETIQKEVEMIARLGVEFQYNMQFGWRIHMTQLLKEGFEAFLFTIGAHKCSPISVKGENDFAEVYTAVSFLREVALGDRQKPGNRVVIIGGGNVAIDSARTCIRLGCKEVNLVYRRSREEMPADYEEIEQAEEEGVKMNFLMIPTEIIGEAYSVKAMRFIKARLVKVKGSKRKRPQPIEGTEFTMEVDAIISAVGQRIDQVIMNDLPNLEWTRWNTIGTGDVTMETSLEGIFAAGDAVSGPATVVEAIAGGKRAADAIDRYLSKKPPKIQTPVPPRSKRVPLIETDADEKMTLPRASLPLLDYQRRRTSFQQVELGFSEESAKKEARRCLRCDICIRCRRCVEICRDEMGIGALEFGYMDADHPRPTDFRVTREKCISCGACAVNCPNDAIRIEDRDGDRLLVLCGTVLNRQKLISCRSCGAAAGTAVYLDYIKNKIGTIGQIIHDRQLCDSCARKENARKSVGDFLNI